MSVLRRYELSFFTATILEWKGLLKNDKYKDIILESLKFLTGENRIRVYAFVIMDNHIHLIWHIQFPHILMSVQRDLLKYTAQQIKFDLLANHPSILEQFRVQAKDRQFQFWERNPLSVALFSERVVRQKLDYIHNNPVRKHLVDFPSDYHYSSAKFYEAGIDHFGFLSSIYS